MASLLRHFLITILKFVTSFSNIMLYKIITGFRSLRNGEGYAPRVFSQLLSKGELNFGKIMLNANSLQGFSIVIAYVYFFLMEYFNGSIYALMDFGYFSVSSAVLLYPLIERFQGCIR